jgi:hypothetical protein
MDEVRHSLFLGLVLPPQKTLSPETREDKVEKLRRKLIAEAAKEIRQKIADMQLGCQLTDEEWDEVMRLVFYVSEKAREKNQNNEGLKQ